MATFFSSVLLTCFNFESFFWIATKIKDFFAMTSERKSSSRGAERRGDSVKTNEVSLRHSAGAVFFSFSWGTRSFSLLSERKEKEWVQKKVSIYKNRYFIIKYFKSKLFLLDCHENQRFSRNDIRKNTSSRGVKRRGDSVKTNEVSLRHSAGAVFFSFSWGTRSFSLLSERKEKEWVQKKVSIYKNRYFIIKYFKSKLFFLDCHENQRFSRNDIKKLRKANKNLVKILQF